ncbi:ABC-three component system middle component 1 [Flavobacterium hydrophilum]|uniref:Uncharacterized protein n=1 Tax=Flavobacterium hydrophilum TaxID=2211445 RepID=A0A2V4C3L8_9FLAO|nr:ABC-three component system middle component 1 [Flavobacterium hydrophilum]PXY45888.1 hypothetical protein DMB68_01470 [Flavobacterium hydrophilum]
MISLIENIIEQSELSLINIKKFKFAYFKDRDDFFIIYNADKETLLKENNNTISDLEFLINALIVDFKNESEVTGFKERFLDENLSFILLLNIGNEEDENFTKELHKVEENYRVAKKYILPYKNNDFRVLEEKISISENIIHELNRIAIEYSNLLNNKNETWYRLLMSLFIKVPFLNYVPLGNNQQLRNIKNEIDNVLNEPQKLFTDKILNDYIENSNIEEFLLTNNLFIDETDE